MTFDDLRDAHPIADGWLFGGGSPDVPVTPTGPRVDLAVVYLVTALPAALANVVALVMLTRVITTPAIATDSILFSGATVDRLRRIGWFVVIASVILWVFSIATWNLLRASLPPGIFPAAPPSVMGEPLTGPSLTLGIVILVVAWIIQRGRVMREDLAGVI